MNLKIDRRREHLPETGIWIRAQASDGERWVTANLSHLDRESAVTWLKSLDTDGLVATILHLLGHEEE